jgi:hypothetical protein
MDGLPGLNWYVHYIEYSLYGGSLYRGTTVLSFIIGSQRRFEKKKSRFKLKYYFLN